MDKKGKGRKPVNHPGAEANSSQQNVADSAQTAPEESGDGKDNASLSHHGGAASSPLGVNLSTNSSNAVGGAMPRHEAAGMEATVAAAEAAARYAGLEGLAGVDLDALIAHYRELCRRMQAERDEFTRKMEQAEEEIHRAAERMYGAVDNRVNELLAAAAEVRSERSSQLQGAKSEMQTSLASLNYHHMFANQLLEHGSPEQLTQYAPLLHADAERLCSEPFPQLPEVTHESQNKLAALQAFANLNVDELRQEVGGNLLGQVRQTEGLVTDLPPDVSPYLDEPRLVASSTAGSVVCGLAFLDDRLFVVRERSSVVEAYLVSGGFAPGSQISVEQMTCPQSMVASVLASCLVISDAEVRGLFRISLSADAEVTLIPLDGIPSGLSSASNGSVVFTFAETRVIKMICASHFNTLYELDIGTIDRPIAAVPVNGEDNGFLICSKTEDGLSWFICGHKLDDAARPLEEPLHLRSLRDVSGLVPDPFGSYVGIGGARNSVSLFDSTFALLRPLLSTPGDVEHPTSLAVNAHNGQVAVGQRDGVVKIYQFLRTRETVEIAINPGLPRVLQSL